MAPVVDFAGGSRRAWRRTWTRTLGACVPMPGRSRSSARRVRGGGCAFPVTWIPLPWRSFGGRQDAAARCFRGPQGSSPVVVGAIDAGAVSFLGSAGLAVMVRYAEAGAAAGRRPVLRAASGPVDHLLRLAGMDPSSPRPEPARPAAGDEMPDESR